MEQIIQKNYRHHHINLLVPAVALSDNILSHRISHQQYQIMLPERPVGRILTYYYYDDLVLEVAENGSSRCYTEQIHYSHFSPDQQLRFVRKSQIPLSVTKFKPSTHYGHVRQVLIIDFELDSATVILEATLPEITQHRDPVQELKGILEQPDYPISLSYRIQLHHGTPNLSDLPVGVNVTTTIYGS